MAEAARTAVWKQASLGKAVTEHRKPMDWASVAEDADAYLPPSPMAEREVRTNVVLLHGRDGGAWSNLAGRIRFDEASVETGVAATRHWFTDREVGEFRWLIGPSATPRGVAVVPVGWVHGGLKCTGQRKTAATAALSARRTRKARFISRATASFCIDEMNGVAVIPGASVCAVTAATAACNSADNCGSAAFLTGAGRVFTTRRGASSTAAGRATPRFV